MCSCFYMTGEPVEIGDFVTYVGEEGVVVAVIKPGREANDHYGVPEGGVLIRELSPTRWGQVLLSLPGRDNWEDLCFVRRVRPEKSSGVESGE